VDLPAHARACYTRRDALLRGPLLECPSEHLVQRYSAFVVHAIRAAAAAAAERAAPTSNPTSPSGTSIAAADPDFGGGGSADAFTEVLALMGSLLALLADAAALLRTGGRAGEAASGYLHLLGTLDADPLLSRCMRLAATPAARRLLQIFLPEPDDELDDDGQDHVTRTLHPNRNPHPNPHPQRAAHGASQSVACILLTDRELNRGPCPPTVARPSDICALASVQPMMADSEFMCVYASPLSQARGGGGYSLTRTATHARAASAAASPHGRGGGHHDGASWAAAGGFGVSDGGGYGGGGSGGSVGSAPSNASSPGGYGGYGAKRDASPSGCGGLIDSSPSGRRGLLGGEDEEAKAAGSMLRPARQAWGSGAGGDDDEAAAEEQQVWNGLLGTTQNHLHGFAGGALSPRE
jgi:hypothetical protein